MPDLTPKQLAARMRKSIKTLEKWRARKCGPPYYKIGNEILYDEAEYLDWRRSKRVAA